MTDIAALDPFERRFLLWATMVDVESESRVFANIYASTNDNSGLPALAGSPISHYVQGLIKDVL